MVSEADVAKVVDELVAEGLAEVVTQAGAVPDLTAARMQRELFEQSLRGDLAGNARSARMGSGELDELTDRIMTNPHLAGWIEAERAAVLRQSATGTMPADAEWEHAEQALAATPEAAVPQPVREAVDALGNLVSIWQGYGEEDL